MISQENYLTVAQVSQLTGLKEQTIRNKVHKREIPFHRIGKSLRFLKLEIEDWIKFSKFKGDVTFIKKGNKYYIHIDKDPQFDEIRTEEDLFKYGEAQGDFSSGFVSKEEYRKNAKKIIAAGLIYPKIIKKKTYIYESMDSYFLGKYVNLLKIFSSKLGFNVVFEIKDRILENLKKEIVFPEIELVANHSNAIVAGNPKSWGYYIENMADEILAQFSDICLFLSPEGECDSFYLPYVEKYKDPFNFLDLYLRRFIYCVGNTNDDSGFFYWNLKTIDELTPEKIKEGLKMKLFSKEEVNQALKKRISSMEKDLSTLKKIIQSGKSKK